MDLTTNSQVALAGLAIGVAFGALARWSGFCLRGGVEDFLTKADAPRLRGFMTAMVVALVATQALVLSGRLDLSKALVLGASLPWLGAVLGGAMFGAGMVLTGGCGSRLLVLAAGGNLRSAVSFVVFALVAYASIRGILAPVRSALAAAGSVTLGNTTLPLAAGAVAAAVALVFIAWRRAPARDVVAGILIGLLVPIGYLATGVLGADEFERAPVESLNLVRAGGDSLMYLLVWTGAKANFGIGFVAGILLGAFVVALARGELKLVGFAQPADMLRYAGGAALMGAGGVMALGCTIGNGLTGIASLAPVSFIAVPAMVLAAAATMKWRWRKG
jgi:uncharacterized membrane protein YedE/YeeE